MTPGEGTSWSADIPCAKTGDLLVSYDLVEGGDTQHFEVPLGGLVLIDPAGVVYDKAAFDEAKATGKSDDAARSDAAIEGATVRLQRRVDGEWRNVLSGDPGITPNVNPQVPGENGW